MGGAVFSLVGAIIMAKPTPAEAAKILKSWEPVVLAGEVLDHDINPDDHYQVEQFLRRKNPKISRRLIGACIMSAEISAPFDSAQGRLEVVPFHKPRAASASYRVVAPCRRVCHIR